MKLFVKCHRCGHKIRVNSDARVRSELPPYFSLRCTNLSCPIHGQEEFYSSAEVFAEPGHAGKLGGAVVLGALGGLIGGPIGAAIGAGVGASAGAGQDEEDERAAEVFNRS